MKLLTRGMVLALAAIIVVLVLVVSYLSYSNLKNDLNENGAYYVNFRATFEGEIGTLQIKNPSLTVVYDKTPDFPGYVDWLFPKGEPSQDRGNDSAVYAVHVKLTTLTRDKIPGVLLDKTYSVYFTDIFSSIPLVLNETFGPFIAYNSTLPFKVSYVIDITGLPGQKQTSSGAYYVMEWRE